MKKISAFIILALIPFILLGCGIGNTNSSISIVYVVTSALSFLILGGYFAFIHKCDRLFILLFFCVAVINCGYLWLSVSDNLTSALFANRLAYLGSVFLPLIMLQIISRVCKLEIKKWIPITLSCLSIIVFLIAATPGYSNLYYRSVSLETVGGVSVLQKDYGPLHTLYPIYLLGYFSAIIFIMIYASVKKRLTSFFHVFILWSAVFVNIGVWLFEQSVDLNFEFLSISYIITELFLLSLNLMIQHFEQLQEPKLQPVFIPCEDEELCSYFSSSLPSLTPTERKIYDLYLAGNGTKDILQELCIKENTLKYHNKNIYSKLGVSSRKQLIQIANTLKSGESL